jgi:DNA adenine methylase
MPSHVHYVEPFAGGLAVLLAKEPNGVSEVVNELHGGLTNFWRMLQDAGAFERFARIVAAVPFSEAEWNDAGDRLNDPDAVRRAVAFFVYARQSLAGRMGAFAPLSRSRTRRGMNEQASAWLNAIEGLPAVHARLKRGAIVGPKPAVKVVREQDGPGTLFYCDPPYLHSTRTAPDTYGPYEMSERQHRELLDNLRHINGKAMLSGYRSGLYDTMLADWTQHDFDLPNNAASGARKRRMMECLWCNW